MRLNRFFFVPLFFFMSAEPASSHLCSAALQDQSGIQDLSPLKLVQDLRDRERETPTETPQIPLQNSARLAIFFPQKYLRSILRRGFLNQFQTGHSKGWYDPDQRAASEDLLISTSLPRQGRGLKIRPKSSFVLLDAPIRIPGLADGPHPSAYGDIGAVLKRAANNYSIWTNGDSLEVASAIRNGSIPISEIDRYRGTFDRNLPAMTNHPMYRKLGVGFVEGLIFGRLGMNDVDHFVVFDDTAAEPLFAVGKPVFLVSMAPYSGRHEYKYLRVLSAGLSSPESLPSYQKKEILSALRDGQSKIEAGTMLP